jgi:hypothetical protein
MVFDQLVDWAEHPAPGVKHFSGKAIYRQRFELEPSIGLGSASRVFLDLGEVRDLARVRLNGKELGTLWKAPWRIEVTGALQSGPNVVEVEVVNVWNIRLVADQSLPKEQRRTFLLAPTVKRDSPLLPAGLLGPVLLRQEVEARFD